MVKKREAVQEENADIFQYLVSDYTFKNIFGSEKNKRFLINFLNSSISQYVGEIADVTFRTTEVFGDHPSEKKVIYDIFCKDINGMNFIIEMQCVSQKEYINRSIFYLSRAISASIEKGKNKYRFQYTPTYSVNILNFELPEFKLADEDCLRVFFYKDEKNRILTTKNAIFYLNLRNFASHQLGVTEECRKWLFMIKNMQRFTEQDYRKQTGIFKELMDECRINKLAPIEMEKYHKSVLEYEEVKNAVAYADECAYNRGIEKGRSEGKAEIARRMMQLGFDLKTILSATGLSLEEVENFNN